VNRVKKLLAGWGIYIVCCIAVACVWLSELCPAPTAPTAPKILNYIGFAAISASAILSTYAAIRIWRTIGSATSAEAEMLRSDVKILVITSWILSLLSIGEVLRIAPLSLWAIAFQVAAAAIFIASSLSALSLAKTYVAALDRVTGYAS